jgi:Flp pilus assembly protein TadG
MDPSSIIPTEDKLSRHRGEHSRQGQAVVEFAFTSLLLLLTFFGALDLGRAVFTRALLTNAVREAARTGSSAPADLTAMRTAAAQRSPGLGLTATSTVITATCYSWNGVAWVVTNCSGAQSGNRLVVQASYQFGLTAPRLIGFSTITMGERAQVGIQ